MTEPQDDRVTEPNDTEWYWDLDKRIAVQADSRGPADHTLGPYATKAEAENWKSTTDRRNDIWESDDEIWNSDNRGDD